MEGSEIDTSRLGLNQLDRDTVRRGEVGNVESRQEFMWLDQICRAPVTKAVAKFGEISANAKPEMIRAPLIVAGKIAE